jgi:transcriptional regulator with XRE-family HTH domain
LGYLPDLLKNAIVSGAITIQVTPESVLRQIRQTQGVRQTELAAKLGKPQSFVSKYESLERRLNFEEVELVCQALEITMTEFIAHLETARIEKP